MTVWLLDLISIINNFPSIWYEFPITSNVRTTNGCELYYSRLNRRFYNPRRNIFDFDELLKAHACRLRCSKKKKKTSILDKKPNLRE